ncbi:MAG: FAD-binding protein [Chloroflexi bacterium]|nr:FAD-binding protein [Chloroflexota bacterium]
MPYHPVLVVGGGLAGLRAALEARFQGVEAAVLSLVHPLRSHSGAAQGGVNAPLGNSEEGKDDTPERHAYETVVGSDFLADQDAVEAMTREATERIFELEHWGAPFSRTPQGKIAQRPFGGGAFPRTCYAADRTGHYLLHTLYQQALKYRVQVYIEWTALSLVVAQGQVQGVVALHLPSGEIETFSAGAVVMATGGAGRLYRKSTNALINTGHGLALAYTAGAPLKDMEFIQFHPTSLYGSNILISEAARGERGYLLNNQGERFMQRYAPRFMELAPRDIVARSVITELKEGRGFDGAYVLLDLRHLGAERILERLPGIRELAISFAGVDPIEEPIPVEPAQHYTMGGIDCNTWGESRLPGLLACGECACVSVHGANRLGGNSLLETVVFGQRAGRRAAELARAGASTSSEEPLKKALEEARTMIEGFKRSNGNEDPASIREEMRRAMWEGVGIFREKEGLEGAVARLQELGERARRLRPAHGGQFFNQDLLRCWELPGQLLVAEAIAGGALRREESRGSHFRLDFPQRDDARFLHHTLAHLTPEGPRFEPRDVAITRWPPEVRKY